MPISPRLDKARLKRVTMNLTVVEAYSATLDAEEEEAKDTFYDDPQDTSGNDP